MKFKYISLRFLWTLASSLHIISNIGIDTTGFSIFVKPQKINFLKLSFRKILTHQKYEISRYTSLSSRGMQLSIRISFQFA